MRKLQNSGRVIHPPRAQTALGLKSFERHQVPELTGFIGALPEEAYTGHVMNNHIKLAGLITLFAAHAAHAQVVIPGRIFPIAPVLPVIAPVMPNILPTLPRPAAPVLPIPTLPGVPTYRLIAPVAVAQPVAAAQIGVVVPVVTFAKAAVVDQERAGEIRPSAPTRAIERAQRGFGLKGKKVDAPRLQAIFDGSDYSLDNRDAVVIVEEIERPQTLPETDLLREIGVAYPNK